MEKLVLTIGGLLKLFSLSDLFFFAITLFVLILLAYVIYLSRVDEVATQKEVKKDEQITKIINELSQTQRMEPVELSEYEQEQENTAIISYDELMKANNNSDIKEQEVEENITFDKLQERSLDKVQYVANPYSREEEILRNLKTLQNNLVR